ncbi:MAG: ATP-binding protein [Planctomycetes bacterium]|jgi:serine/threonine-protein kinase RsbW|nr:ATP-binding protein [Planctomycetota bacterium]
MKFHQHLTISNDHAYLSQVRDLVSRGVTVGDFPSHFLNRLQIAVDEAVTNIIEHGYAGHARGSARIEITVDVDSERFRIQIVDTGMSFDPNQMTDVDIQSHVAAGKAGGLGVFLMRKIMDQVDYQYQSGKMNQLTLVKLSGK